jgi:hypothetical protein
MVNRSIQQKILKMKRRGRKAIFSGATTKYMGKVTGMPTPNNLAYEVPVGPISLSKQVINTGRGPNAERMAEYYSRLRSFTEEIPPTKQRLMSEPFKEMYNRYKEIVDDTKEMHIALVPDCHLGRTDLFFKSGGNEFFIVDIDYKQRTFRRSRIYGRKEVAIERWKSNRVTWVEFISPQS